MTKDLLHKDLTELILKCFYQVYNELGYGFLEKVYENAMMIELREMGLKCANQAPVEVVYRDQNVGHYFADLMINDVVIVELKAAESLCPEHEAQLINYLKATDCEVGLLLNFGKKAQFRRKIFHNELKKKRHDAT
jgi:GxxExxY protein